MRVTWPKAAPALLCLCLAGVIEPATAWATPSTEAAAPAAPPCDSIGKPIEGGTSVPEKPRQAAAPRNLNATMGGVPKGSDPFLAAMLGALPLASGYYLTSTPQKGIAFTLADVLLIGAVAQARNDERSHADPGVYYLCMGAVNIADLVLSVWQVKTDNARRLSVSLNDPTRPGLTVAWHL